MTSRILPEAEWDRLHDTELAEIRAMFRPHEIKVLVIEDDAGEIRGCWGLFPVWHVEGLWIAPEDRRSGSVARRLLKAMRALIKAEGAGGVVTASVDPSVSDYLTRIGARPLPGEAFVWPMKES